jgi:hypothetical protein
MVATLKEVASKLEIPLSVAHIYSSEIANISECPLVLLRPDGHVCWRGTQIEEAQRLLKTISGH